VSAGRRPPASGGPTLLDAMADPALFGPWFTPEGPWAAWRAFLAALFGSRCLPDQFALYRRHTGRPAPLAAERTLVQMANLDPDPLWMGRLVALPPSPSSTEPLRDDGATLTLVYLLGGGGFKLITGGDDLRWHGPC
jgi:hypothetical protein